METGRLWGERRQHHMRAGRKGPPAIDIAEKPRDEEGILACVSWSQWDGALCRHSSAQGPSPLAGSWSGSACSLNQPAVVIEGGNGSWSGGENGGGEGRQKLQALGKPPQHRRCVGGGSRQLRLLARFLSRPK